MGWLDWLFGKVEENPDNQVIKTDNKLLDADIRTAARCDVTLTELYAARSRTDYYTYHDKPHVSNIQEIDEWLKRNKDKKDIAKFREGMDKDKLKEIENTLRWIRNM